MQIISFKYHIDEIEVVAQKVLGFLNSKTVLFIGEMGSGKTTFINALLKAMDSKDNATSPTFSIVNEYKLKNDKIFHFDFYRIDNLEEAYNFGVEDYFNSAHWLFIEWPERIDELLPSDVQIIEIETLSNKERNLKLSTNKNLTETKAMTVPKF